MKLWKRPEAVERDLFRAKASKRFSTVSTANLIPMCESQLGTAWREFDRFQDHPELATLEEWARQVSALQGAIDVLRPRFDTKL